MPSAMLSVQLNKSCETRVSGFAVRAWANMPYMKVQLGGDLLWITSRYWR
jgi:hypothetical protein